MIDASQLRGIVVEWIGQIRDGSAGVDDDEGAIEIIRAIGATGTDEILVMFKMMDEGLDADEIARRTARTPSKPAGDAAPIDRDGHKHARPGPDSYQSPPEEPIKRITIKRTTPGLESWPRTDPEMREVTVRAVRQEQPEPRFVTVRVVRVDKESDE